MARSPFGEEHEMELLAAWLDARRVLWCHVPNGGHRNVRVAAALKRQGVKRGVPDALVFERPPLRPEFVGVAIELKVAGGRLSRYQRAWLTDMEQRNWLTMVPFGAQVAIRELMAVGF